MHRLVCGRSLSSRRRTWFIYLLRRTLRIRRNFLNARIYRSELNASPRIPLTIVLHCPGRRQPLFTHRSLHINFFLKCRWLLLPPSDFLFIIGPNDEHKFHHRKLFLAERQLRLSHCAVEFLNRRVFGIFFILILTVIIFGIYFAQTVLYTSSTTIDTTAGFPILTAANSSHIFKRRSSRICALTFSLVSVVTAMVGRPCRTCYHCPFRRS